MTANTGIMDIESLTEFGRLSRDVKEATRTLDKREARYLVDLYYQVQNYRIASRNQERSMETDGEPHATISFFGDQMRVFENQIQRVLAYWTDNDPLGAWAKGITGIGPVISAGLLAHIDIAKAPTAGHIWRYAGQDPTSIWEKGQKRPWNASLKVVCWKAGESFVKVSSNKTDTYGKFYIQRKQFETIRNDAVREVPSAGWYQTEMPTADHNVAGEFTPIAETVKVEAVEIAGKYYIGGHSSQAAQVLQRKKIGKDTDAIKSYSIGKLPPAHIHARAKRYAVKLFLAHYQEVGYRLMYNEEPPAPYPIAILGHAHRIYPPNLPRLNGNSNG